MRSFILSLVISASFLLCCSTSRLTQQPTTPEPTVTTDTAQADTSNETTGEAIEPELVVIELESSWTVAESDITDQSMQIALIANAEDNVTARISVTETGCGWNASWHVNYARDGRQCVDADSWSVDCHGDTTVLEMVDDEDNQSDEIVIRGLRVSWPAHIARGLQDAMNSETRAGICF